jgi:hypothetical protein
MLIQTRVERDVYAKLEALAQKSERTVAGELRIALKAHLAAANGSDDAK